MNLQVEPASTSWEHPQGGRSVPAGRAGPHAKPCTGLPCENPLSEPYIHLRKYVHTVLLKMSQLERDDTY